MKPSPYLFAQFSGRASQKWTCVSTTKYCSPSAARYMGAPPSSVGPPLGDRHRAVRLRRGTAHPSSEMKLTAVHPPRLAALAIEPPRHRRVLGRCPSRLEQSASSRAHTQRTLQPV